MKYYLNLQFKIINRHLKDAGIHPLPFYIIAAVAYFMLSFYLFERFEYIEYLYCFFAIYTLFQFSSKSRNDFLKNVYTKVYFYKIKLVENSLLILPFLLILLLKEKYLTTFILLPSAWLISTISLNELPQRALSTPFYRYPFEYAIGFRKTYLVILLAYFISLIGILVDNFFLSLFGLAIILLNCLSFQNKLEPRFYIWIFSASPKQFLYKKLKTAILYSCLLSLPTSVFITIFFFDYIHTILIVNTIGLLIIIAAVAGKYSQYPSEINLIQSIYIALAILFPPLLLVIIPLFYHQSIKRLNNILQ